MYAYKVGASSLTTVSSFKQMIFDYSSERSLLSCSNPGESTWKVIQPKVFIFALCMYVLFCTREQRC